MSNYWIGDSVGRVLGPLTLQSLRELVSSGRLKAVTRASRDGESWEPIAQFNEVKDLFSTLRPGSADESGQAARLRTQLGQMQAMSAWQILGLKPEAPLEEVRAAFFRMARRFSPEHLSAATSPELRKVHADIFELLARRMREAEAQRATAPAAPVAAGPRTATPAGGRAAVQAPAYTYSAEEFVGLRTQNDRTQVEIRVNARNMGIFTDHRIVNLQAGGLFIPTSKPLRLGTRVELVLNFEQPPREIKLRSSVIWEYTLDDGKQPRGYGLGLADLKPEERTFLDDFLRTHRPQAPTTAG
ncbi:TIGR02266 family protein [Cystobacter ferrugineus]|uniref:Molecular chaperone DnaJ n=1 Tax=Cystobacter ferrugineus TaxID=83449 RepID=A0A1L9BIL9_9BACT|nr:TIGR02266 family protein [Cystobacter ferrugineus]OJH41998.1 molecular chaperone DnaJ [Cystobacter ferrugineus]